MVSLSEFELMFSTAYRETLNLLDMICVLYVAVRSVRQVVSKSCNGFVLRRLTGWPPPGNLLEIRKFSVRVVKSCQLFLKLEKV